MYPSQDTLDAIENWSLTTPESFRHLAEFLLKNWEYENYATLKGNTLKLSTGGWSGNEDMISALQRNKTFEMICWESSKRGGHFVYKLPKIKKIK